MGEGMHTDIVAAACNGKYECEYVIDETKFNLPPTDGEKDFELTY